MQRFRGGGGWRCDVIIKMSKIDKTLYFLRDFSKNALVRKHNFDPVNPANFVARRVPVPNDT